MGAMKRLAILGSTGSIGTSALAVVDAHPDRLAIVGLAAGRRATELGAQVARYRPLIAAIAQEADAACVRAAAGDSPTTLVAGPHGLTAVATHPDVDIVLCASSGTAALEAVLAAIDAGKTIALANKEVLVMAGEMVTRAARRRGVDLLPVDSEHNAIHQCVHGRRSSEIKRLILTASGGPFRTWSAAALESVGPEEALRHPTWQMGRKITIDSATLMNKGLEVIEAHWLFGVPADRIDVVVHPQSIVHSMVELTDGSTIAQLGVTDMRLPIQYAFSYPERWSAPLPPLDLTRAAPLEFMAPDLDRFPCLRLAYAALRAGGTAMVALNTANEVAVDAFLAGRLIFPAIARVIDGTLTAHDVQPADTLEAVREADRWARSHAANLASSLELKV
jgi:1-deoxy-D-xylulose-5-phosphate reductoisomerase